MATNNVNLGSIDFDQIKTSLTEYLKTQDFLKDYNFEGSAIQSIVNLLSYNTLYYAMYSNMLANEMFLDTAQREESIVSLVKPLGVSIPTRTSSRLSIKLGGNSFLPKYSQFVGKNSSGVNYNFYTFEDYSEVDAGSDFIDNIVLIEAKQLISNKDISNLINYSNQTYFIGDINIDISTLVVEVDKGDGIYQRWSKLDNIGDSTENLSQNIYFIERFDTGFEIQFGVENSLGNSILETYNTRITYAISSGSAANQIVNFQYLNDSTSTIEIYGESSGGLNSPDLDYYRFIAPKFFAAQNRAITKDDFLAISMEYLKNKGYDVTKDNFTVYGGDEVSPPKYGRVFIATDAIPDGIINELVAFLKTKCAITILPEYVLSNNDNLSYDVELKFVSGFTSKTDRQRIISNIRSFLNQNYTILNKYNISFDLVEIENALQNNFPEIRSAQVILRFNKLYGNASDGININLENRFNIQLGIEKAVTKPFADKSGRTVQLRAKLDNLQQADSLIKLKTYVLNSSNEYSYNSALNYGNINIQKGILQINSVPLSSVEIDIDFSVNKFITSQNTKFSIIPNRIIDLEE